MSDTNGTPATWHGVPRPEGLDEALSHARGQLGDPMTNQEFEDYAGTGWDEPEDDELERVPEHHNDLGDWCPGSGRRTSDGTCPQYCRHADELTGFDAGERGGDDDPAEVSQATGPSLPGVWTPGELRAVVLTAGEIADAYGTGVDGLDGNDILSTRQRELLDRATQAFRAEGAEDEPAPAEALTRAAEQVEQATGADFDTAAQLARQAMRRCALCGALGELERINAGPSLACVNIELCQLRTITSDPLGLLARAARGVAKDVGNMSEIELARVILTLKRTVVAAEIELGNHRDRARGDAALAQAAEEMGPRVAADPPLPCRECGSTGACTYPCAPGPG